jgi:D-alanyl-D-alanine-carboxypeptidase/D-alanyl-D-alanine-endopeptidase
MLRFSAILLLSLTISGAERPPIPHFTDPNRRARLEAALPQVTALFENFWRDRGAPGLVFGVVIDGDLALVKGFGEQDRDTHAPVTPDTVFRIASMTKSFTALAILQLRDEGKLSLEDPVAKWIPEFAAFDYPTRDTAPIRIRTLLTHGAGFPEDNPWGDRQLSTPDDTLTAWLKKGLPFSTPPDTAYEYSNYGFALLGRIVARCSGVPYPEYIARHILQPLQMRASTLEPESVPAALRATGYGRNGGQYQVIPSLPHGAFGSMGGMLVSARDLGRYVAFHLSAWPPRDDPESGPVRRSSVREMQHPWRPQGFQAGRTSAYGYGLGVSQTCQFHRIVSHGGGLPGFGSYMMWLPDYGVGVFVMANLTYTAGGAIAEQALDALRRTGALQPRELPPSSDLLAAREAIIRIWNTRAQGAPRRELEALAADNLFQDRTAPDRMTQIERLQGEAGTCLGAGPMKPDNLLRGGFRIPCEKGAVDVYFTLSPTMPPKVQRLDFSSLPNLSPAARKSVDALAAAIGRTDSETARVPAGQLYAVRLEMGSCRFGELLSRNESRATVRLECDHGALLARVELDSDGKLKNVQLLKPEDQSCAP